MVDYYIKHGIFLMGYKQSRIGYRHREIKISVPAPNLRNIFPFLHLLLAIDNCYTFLSFPFSPHMRAVSLWPRKTSASDAHPRDCADSEGLFNLTTTTRRTTRHTNSEYDNRNVGILGEKPMKSSARCAEIPRNGFFSSGTPTFLFLKCRFEWHVAVVSS